VGTRGGHLLIEALPEPLSRLNSPSRRGPISLLGQSSNRQVSERVRISEIPTTDEPSKATIRHSDYPSATGAFEAGAFASFQESQRESGREYGKESEAPRNSGSLPLTARESFVNSPLGIPERTERHLRSESVDSEWAAALAADELAGNSEQHAGHGQGSHNHKPLIRPQGGQGVQGGNGAQGESGRHGVPFPEAPLPPAARSNLLTAPSTHTMAALEQQLAGLHAEVAAGALLPPELAEFAKFAAERADGKSRPPKSTQVLNMRKSELRFGDVPSLEPPAEQLTLAVGSNSQLVRPMGRKSPALSPPSAHLSDPFYSADRELEVRSVERLPPQQRVGCEPVSQHALLSRSLFLLATESAQ